VRYAIRTITPVADIPLVVSLPQAKNFLKDPPSTDDALVTAQIRTAMDLVERFCSQVLTARVMELVGAAFPLLPELISIPREPVTGIVSVSYTDRDSGAEVVMDGASWRWADHAPDQLLPAFRQAWPLAASERGSVRVRFEAGYEDGLCPPALVEAVKKTVARLYENREASGLGADVMADLAPFRRSLV
jgi:uncharacterized phiE125 gp8 family phage protein